MMVYEVRNVRKYEGSWTIAVYMTLQLAQAHLLHDYDNTELEIYAHIVHNHLVV